MLVLVFVAVLLLLESLYLTWRAHRGPEAKKMKSRLHALSATRDRSAQTQLLRQRMLSELPPMERLLQSLPRLRQIDRTILQSGLGWNVSSAAARPRSSCFIAGGPSWSWAFSNPC